MKSDFTKFSAKAGFCTPPCNSHRFSPDLNGSRTVVERTVKGLLFLCVLSLCSLNVWGGTTYTSEWDGWAEKEQLPAANTPSTKNNITLESSIAPSNGWLWGTLCNAYNPENVEGFHIDITTTDAANIEFSDVMIEIRYEASVPNTVYIQFYTTPSIDDAKKNGDPVVLNADGQNYLGDWKQVPSGSRSARIYRTATSYGPWFYGFHITTQAAATVFHKVHYLAGEGQGTMADGSVGENKSFKLPQPQGLNYSGHNFTKWSDGNNLYAVGDDYQMGTSDLTFTAQWEAVVVPTVTGLQIKSPLDNVVPLVWSIPGICDLSKFSLPLAKHNDTYVKDVSGYSYSEENDVITITGNAPQYEQFGVAFPVDVYNLNTITYEYSASSLNSDVNIWCGAISDEPKAYWQFSDPMSTDRTAGWHSQTVTPTQPYWGTSDGGSPISNPITQHIKQIGLYVNYENPANQTASFRNVRYHVQDAVDIKEVVVMRKAGSASTSITDGTEIYRGIKSKFTDSDEKVNNTTYYYTVFALDNDDNVSAAVTVSYTYSVKEAHTVTYARGGEDVTGDLPVTVSYKDAQEFTVAEKGNLSRQGYKFTGWNDGTDDYQPGDTYTMPDEAVTLTAQWEEYIRIPQTTRLDISNLTTTTSTLEPMVIDGGTCINLGNGNTGNLDADWYTYITPGQYKVQYRAGTDQYGWNASLYIYDASTMEKIVGTHDGTFRDVGFATIEYNWDLSSLDPNKVYIVRAANEYNGGGSRLKVHYIDFIPSLVLDQSKEDNLIINGKANVTLIRPLAAGMSNSICLPFALDNDQIKTAFGTDAQVWALENATLSEDNTSLELNFEQVETMEAGVPYLIVPGTGYDNTVNPVFTGVTVTTTLAPVSTDNVEFIGNVQKSLVNVGHKDCLFVGNNNVLQWPAGSGYLKGMRAYFRITYHAGAVPAGVQARMNFGHNTPTGWQDIQDGQNAVQKILRDGHIYILRDGQVCDIMGNTVK